MHFRFFFSAPAGRIELDPEDLIQPFLVSPGQEHPFLTLKDYFHVLQKFILLDNGKQLEAAMAARDHQEWQSPAEISEIQICSEKHGAFYHIASVALIGRNSRVTFSLTTALSKSARNNLENEFLLMQQFSAAYPEFLPQMYYRRQITWQTDSGAEKFFMVLGEWLDDYHEWHMSHNQALKNQQIQLWDYDRGCRFLSERESYALLRQAAYILSCLYDQDSFCQVYPWHHGAGDFIVKAPEDVCTVKLITIRQYEPLIFFDKPEKHDRLIAAIHFLLNLSVRIRLDRLDGINEPVWLDKFAVQAAAEGFLAGLEAPEKPAKSRKVPANELLAILQTFTAEEFREMYESLLVVYADEDQDDFRLIQQNLHAHCLELQQVLQDTSQV